MSIGNFQGKWIERVLVTALVFLPIFGSHFPLWILSTAGSMIGVYLIFRASIEFESRGVVILITTIYLLAFFTGHRDYLKLMPTVLLAISAGLFLVSFKDEKPYVERIARKMEPDLPDAAIPYCWWCTLAWGIYLACLTLISIALLTFSTEEVWKNFHAKTVYLLLAGFAVGEYFIRRIFKKKNKL